MNWKLLHKIIGSLLWLEASLLLLCLGISLFYGESDSMPFLLSAVITAAGGYGFHLAGRGADNNLRRKDAYFLVTETWVIFSIFGMLPFLIGGYIGNVTDAFFETISGFTTTGASILDDVEILPHGLLFWRTMTQWIGGLGIVFFTIALLPSLVGSGSTKVFSAEATGPRRTDAGRNASSHWDGTHRCLCGILLFRWHVILRLHKLCNDNHRNRWFCHSQQFDGILQFAIHRIHRSIVLLPFRHQLYTALHGSHEA